MTTTSPTERPAQPQGPSSKLLVTYQLMQDHYGFYERLYERYEDPVLVPTMHGEALLTHNPELARQIFAHSHPEDYLPFAVSQMRPVLGDGSVLLLGGEAHKHERKLLMPPFHGERMRAYGESMRIAARRQLAHIKEGEEFVAQEVTTATSLEVIVRTVFGVVDEAKVIEMMAALDMLVEALHPVVVFFKALQRDVLGLGPWPKFLRAREAVDALIFEQIQARRASDERGEDILSMMIEARYEDGQPMSDRALRDELVTLLIAGHETTGVALAWALYHLHRSPDRLARQRQELEESKDLELAQLARLPYLSAVCQETLRLFPIVPDVLRVLKAPMQLGDYELKAGQLVGVAICSIHHDAELYPEPMEFRPERFLERKYKPWEYMPFGGGHRRCIGAAFASFELAIVLATWLGEASFELLDTQVKPKRRNVTLGPDTGVRMRLNARP